MSERKVSDQDKQQAGNEESDNGIPGNNLASNSQDERKRTSESGSRKSGTSTGSQRISNSAVGTVEEQLDTILDEAVTEAVAENPDHENHKILKQDFQDHHNEIKKSEERLAAAAAEAEAAAAALALEQKERQLTLEAQAQDEAIGELEIKQEVQEPNNPPEVAELKDTSPAEIPNLEVPKKEETEVDLEIKQEVQEPNIPPEVIAIEDIPPAEIEVPKAEENVGDSAQPETIINETETLVDFSKPETVDLEIAARSVEPNNEEIIVSEVLEPEVIELAIQGNSLESAEESGTTGATEQKRISWGGSEIKQSEDTLVYELSEPANIELELERERIRSEVSQAISAQTLVHQRSFEPEVKEKPTEPDPHIFAEPSTTGLQIVSVMEPKEKKKDIMEILESLEPKKDLMEPAEPQESKENDKIDFVEPVDAVEPPDNKEKEKKSVTEPVELVEPSSHKEKKKEDVQELELQIKLKVKLKPNEQLGRSGKLHDKITVERVDVSPTHNSETEPEPISHLEDAAKGNEPTSIAADSEMLETLVPRNPEEIHNFDETLENQPSFSGAAKSLDKGHEPSTSSINKSCNEGIMRSLAKNYGALFDFLLENPCENECDNLPESARGRTSGKTFGQDFGEAVVDLFSTKRNSSEADIQTLRSETDAPVLQRSKSVPLLSWRSLKSALGFGEMSGSHNSPKFSSQPAPVLATIIPEPMPTQIPAPEPELPEPAKQGSEELSAEKWQQAYNAESEKLEKEFYLLGENGRPRDSGTSTKAKESIKEDSNPPDNSSTEEASKTTECEPSSQVPSTCVEVRDCLALGPINLEPIVLSDIELKPVVLRPIGADVGLVEGDGTTLQMGHDKKEKTENNKPS